LYWSGQLVSLTGNWMQTTAQAWLVLQLSASPIALGLVTMLQFLPFTLLSLFGGVIADRFPKQRIVLLTQMAGLVQALLFATLVLTDLIQLWHVYLLAAFQGTANAIDNPVRQAFVKELVGAGEVGNAVALNSLLFNSARVIGPAIAGIVIASLGIAPALYLNAVSFIAVVVALLLMKPAEFFVIPVVTRGSALQRLVEGVTYAWRTPAILQVLIIVAAIGTFGYNFTILMPLLAGFVLHTGPTGFGFLSTCLGCGSVAAAIATAYTRQITMRRLLLGSAAFSLLLAIVALSPFYALSAVLLVALGFAGVTFATTANTLLQLTAPDELRGRVMSLYVLLFIGSTPIGGFLIGTLSNIFGVPATLLTCAALCTLGVSAALVYRLKTLSNSS
jgi:MFS family permease